MFSEEDDDEYIPLKIAFLDVPGYYNIFNDDSKAMNFKLDDDSLGKIIDIFDRIGGILKIDLYHYSYDDNNGIKCFKTKVSDDRGLRKTWIKQLIQFKMKGLGTIVEFYINTICLLYY